MTKQNEIGAYEAKTRLPAFLREVQAGARFTITQRGRPVAELVPYRADASTRRQHAAQQMRAFMHKHPPVRDVDIKALIEEGRD